MNVRILKTRPEDAKQLADVFYYTWLATYPNRKYKILACDITYHYRNRHNIEELSKRQNDIRFPKKGNVSLCCKSQ